MKLPSPTQIYKYYNNNERYTWTNKAISGEFEPYDIARMAAVRKILIDLDIKNKKLIDVGCGSGVFSDMALSMSSMVTGIDISKTAITILQLRYKNKKNIRFIQGLADKLPVSNSSADIVTCFEVLEHLVEPNTCLKEIHRILRKNGYVLISVPNWFNLDRLVALPLTKYLFLKIKENLKKDNKVSPHLQFHPPKEWEKMFRKSGFRSIRSRPVYIFPPIPYFEGPLGIPKQIENFILLKLKGISVQQKIEDAIYKYKIFQSAGQSHLWLLQKVN